MTENEIGEAARVGDTMGEPDLLMDAKPATEPPAQHDRLVFRTDHLRNYKTLDDLIALEGKDYIPLIKAVWYNVLGTLKAQIVRFGNLETDTRFNLFIPMPSGTGKNNLKQAIQRIVFGCGKEVRAPTSFHPEQLIGKIMAERFHNPEKQGKGLNDIRYIPNYGYLKNDCVIFDEAYHFITRDDKQYDESKTYIRIALDPIGKNLIQKKLVDNIDVPEQRLEYHPHCTITMFLQPKGMDDDNALTGFLRRFNILYIPLVGKNLDRHEEIVNYIKKPRPEVSFDYWKDIAHWDAPMYFDFEDGIDDLLIVCHGDLVNYMRSLGEKQRNYLDRKAYPIFDDLIGMAVVHAISKRSDVVTQQDVKLAYMDLFEFFNLTLDFVNAKVFGNLDYGEKWHGAEAKEIEALMWLAKRGATEKDRSKVTVDAWIDYMSGLFEVGKEAARKHHQKLKKRGLIDSKQDGSHSSQVWITFDPDAGAFDDDRVPLVDTKYWQIANTDNYNPLDTTLPPISPIPLDSGNGDTTHVPPTEDDAEGGTCDTTLKTIAGDMDCKGGRVVTGDIELTQHDRMKAIDRFFGDRNIAYANSDELKKFTPKIADELKIGPDVAFRSVMQYGRDRRWL